MTTTDDDDAAAERTDGLGAILWLALATPFVVFHPLTVVVWGAMWFGEGWTVDVATETNVARLTDEGVRVWLLRSLAIGALAACVKLGLLTWVLGGFRAAARTHVLSQLAYVLLVPLIFVLPAEHEGNIIGFFLAPYAILAGGLGVLVSLTVTVLAVIRHLDARLRSRSESS